ncbi:MAG: DUF2807 domain-containing protein [Schleiferiaceae bacterium]|jgi:hypothetical protein|nr:DUF2807 domain-containing protein [Schleiferiaceae bacterium]
MQIESFSFEQELEDFTKINYQGIGNITLTQGNQPKLKVSSKIEAEDAIEAKMVKGVLKLKVKDPFTLSLKSFARFEAPDLRVELVVKELEEIVFNGLGNMLNVGVLECYDLKLVNKGVGKVQLQLDVKSLTSKLEGAGTLEITGYGERHECKLNGTGKIDAKGFEVEEAVAVAHGIGRIDVYASKKLEAKLTGVGTIRHYGDPDRIESKLKGMGSIIKG